MLLLEKVPKPYDVYMSHRQKQAKYYLKLIFHFFPMVFMKNSEKKIYLFQLPQQQNLKWSPQK